MSGSSSTTVVFAGKRPLGTEPAARLRALLAGVMEDHDLRGTLSVVYVDDASMSELNREFLGKEGPTDVLSFPLRDEASEDPSADDVVGEVLVCVDVARREALERGTPFEREIGLYALHGLLHLVGYDDTAPDARRRMRRAEAKYLARWPDAQER